MEPFFPTRIRQFATIDPVGGKSAVLKGATSLNAQRRTSNAQRSMKKKMPADGLALTRRLEDCHAERSRGISGTISSSRINQCDCAPNARRPTPNVERRTLNEEDAGGGARTHTTLRPLDFESSASANSATPASDGQFAGRLCQTPFLRGLAFHRNALQALAPRRLVSD